MIRDINDDSDDDARNAAFYQHMWFKNTVIRFDIKKKVLITNEMPKVLKGATKINHGTREENVIGRHRHRERF